MAVTSNTGHQAGELATVSLSDLIIGRKLAAPLYDVNGILLLAAGSVITQENKQAIKNRGNCNVCVSQQDLERVTLGQKNVPQNAFAISFDTELTRKIDTIVDAGLLAVKNTGPAVKSEIVFRGRRQYNHEQQERLIEQHTGNSKLLGSMISDVLYGKSPDGNQVASMVAHYLKEMTNDIDHVLCSAVSQFQHDDVSTRSLEVTLLAMAIGIEMNLDQENIRTLGMAGLVQDWGMLLVPEHIREAQHRLNALEMLEIKKHPIYSLEILQQVSALPRIIPIVAYQVHERFNGTGYPRGRRGNSIHPFSRILQVADQFIGMTSPRPYRPAMMRYAAMECLIRQARERAVDPDVVRAFLKIQSLFPIGSYVTLSDGSVAQVLRRNRDFYTQPIVVKVQDSEGNPLDQESPSNIVDLHEADHLSVQQALPTPGSQEIALSDDLYQAQAVIAV